jgi:predicted glycosyltransferase
VQSTAEPTGLTLEEKKVITDLLINYGLPLTSDGKNDFNFLKNKLAAICPSLYQSAKAADSK